MSTYVPDNYDIGVAAPIDSRTVKATTVTRDAIPAGVRFDGLLVYVVQDSITYQLQGGVTNSDWVEIAGGSTGAEYLYNLIDVDISGLANNDQLLYNSTSSTWKNTPAPFTMSGGIITSNSSATSLVVGVPIFNTGGISVAGGENIVTSMNVDESGTFYISSQNTSTLDIFPLLSQTSTGVVNIAGTTIANNTLSEIWGIELKRISGKEGIKVNVDGWIERGLQINSVSDGNIMNVSYQGSNLRTANLTLGTATVPNHGDDDRDFTSNFDNYHIKLGSHGSTGFKIYDAYIIPKTTFQLFEGVGTFHMSEGISQSGTDFNGYVNVLANSDVSAGPIASGYIITEDYIKTNTYFEGDSVFNHNTLEIVDASGANYCKIAEVSVESNEYVTVELDYVLPNSAIGVNKGRVIMQVGFDPDSQTTQTEEVPITSTVNSGYIVNAGGLGTISILNTNGGAFPTFDTGDEIRLPDLIPEQLLTLEYLPGQTGTYYVYNVLGHSETDFSAAIGDTIYIDVTTIQEVTTTLPGESFVTSLFDIKDKSTGETGVIWKAVLNNVGPTKTMTLYTQLTINETFLSYIAKYQQAGTPDVTFFDDQAFIETLPVGTSEIIATTTVGTSYWNITGNDLYNNNSGNVSIGKQTANFKLDIDGTLGLTDSINFLSGTKLISIDGDSKYFKITNPGNSEDLFNISDVGNVFINETDSSSTEAKLNVSADSNSTYAIKGQAYNNASSAARFSGGALGSDVKIVEFSTYIGDYAASITGAGVIDAQTSITIEDGTILEVTDSIFTWNGNNVWTDTNTGGIGDLSNVDLTGLAVDNHIKWDGNNWVVTPISSGVTNLGYTASALNGIVTSDTGNDATIPLATGTEAGLQSPTHYTKLEGIAFGAEVNVQPDWNEAGTGADAYIKNKPTNLSDFSDDLGAAAHIADSTIHVTQSDKNKWNLAEANVQVNWNETDIEADNYIQNKPALTSAATTPVDTVVTAFSSNLITSGAVFTSIDGLEIDPSTGFIRFSDDTLRLTQGSTIINISDVPKLDTDGKVLASQTRTLVGGATHVFTTTAALEASIQGGTDIITGDFIYIAGAGDTHNGMWIAAVLLTGATWDMATAVASFDVLDVTTGANYYTQTEINNAFANNSIEAGNGLTGGSTLAYAGAAPTLSVNAGNGLKINSITKAVEIDTLIGTPTGTIYTP